MMHLRGKPESFMRISDVEPQEDEEMAEAPTEPIQPRSRNERPVEILGERGNTCLVIAIDFGTTFSSVGFRITDDIDRKLDLGTGDIKCVERFPHDPALYSVNRQEVPTESWYIPKPRKRSKEHAVNSSDESPSSEPRHSDEEDQETDLIYGLPTGRGHSDIPPSQPSEFLWGYSLQRKCGNDLTILDPTLRIARPKLILDHSLLTADIRADLHNGIKILKEKRCIRKDIDVITDFLTRLLQHTKFYLMNYHNFDESMPVEFVICVPVAWEQPACRKMQMAVTQAVQRANFSQLSNSSIQNMFMISEPEAAASCVLSGPNNIDVSSRSHLCLPPSHYQRLGKCFCCLMQVEAPWMQQHSLSQTSIRCV